MKSNYLLFNKKGFEIKKYNGKDLAAYIKRKVTDYDTSKVSTESISEISFKFYGYMENFEVVEQFPACIKDYKIENLSFTMQPLCCTD